MLDTFRGLIFGRLRREVAAPRPMISDPERFKPKVQDVADIGVAAIGTSADVHRKSDLQPWQLLLSLVDRDTEVDRVCERLQDLAHACEPRALLVILPCESSDCHDYFLARCVKFDLKDMGHVEPEYWALAWPEKPSTSRLIGDLIKRFSGPSLEDLKSLNDHLEKHGPPICISYVLDAVIEEGIRARYRDNPKLQAKDYPEKIVQLPFVMRGLNQTNARSLVLPFEEASGWSGDPVMHRLIFAGTAANPRRIKRFVNTYYVLSRISELAGAKPHQADAHRLALVLLLQMRAPDV